MNMIFCVSFASFVATVSSVTWSNPVPIPASQHGLVYQPPRYKKHFDPVLMEAFIEVACRDAKKAFPVYLEVANSYEGRVKLVLYQFPLPYHRAAMHGAQTLRIVSDISPGNILCYLNTAFENQHEILDANIVNKTETELISIFADHAEQCGVSRDDFYRLYDNNFGNKAARAEWKYGCSRGVSGTPFVFLNGVFLTNNQDWTVGDYREFIDGLINPPVES